MKNALIIISVCFFLAIVSLFTFGYISQNTLRQENMVLQNQISGLREQMEQLNKNLSASSEQSTLNINDENTAETTNNLPEISNSEESNVKTNTANNFKEFVAFGTTIRYPADKIIRDCECGDSNWAIDGHTCEYRPNYFCKTDGNDFYIFGGTSSDFNDQKNAYDVYAATGKKQLTSYGKDKISMSPYYSSSFGYEFWEKILANDKGEIAGRICGGEIYQDIPGDFGLQVVKKQGNLIYYVTQPLLSNTKEWDDYFNNNWKSGSDYGKISDGFIETTSQRPYMESLYNKYYEIYSY